MTALKVVSASQEYDLNRRRDKSWWLAFGFIVLLSFATRFFKVSEPDHVCWDETHFGKMGSWYINRTFFFDVHPPLGKMLIAASGYFSGYDGSFPFEKPGDKYENTNYLGMRMFCAFLGACIAPFSYLIVWELTGSLNSAILASSLVICDVGVLTLTQYILLDPILLFFIMASTFGMVKFHNYHLNPFSSFWWFWLCLTGSMLSCAVGTKFVGVFVVLLCGLFTINELWDILGDLKKSIFYFWKHFAARAFGLILLPVSIYVFFFYIHLTVLHKSGNGDGFFSSAFQAQLKGNSLHNASMPKDVAYGAIVTLKNKRTGGGYLHSHFHLYPEGVGARQQQITTYTHKDDNNKFLIKPFDREPEEGKIEFVKHGDLIRLEHVTTNRNLHSHREPAPIMKKHFQVTGYGENGVGDPNDIWKVQIISGGSNGVLTAVTTKIKLIHYLTLCVLTTTGKQLPQWAYEQQEVTCNPNLRDPYAIWNIEENIFDLLPNVNFEVYASNFFERFFESHAVMLQGNAGLKPKEGEVTSRPYQWPINYRGQFFSGNGYRIYLLGNPIIWWSNILFLFIFVNLFAFNAILQQRGYGLVLLTPESDLVVLKSSLWLFIGWALHYIPFYAMGRVLYFHHYFPALLFSTMLSGVIINYLIEIVGTKIFSLSFKNHFTRSLLLLILATSFYSFFIFSPLAYGMSGPYAGEVNSTMHGLKWLESWEF